MKETGSLAVHVLDPTQMSFPDRRTAWEKSNAYYVLAAVGRVAIPLLLMLGQVVCIFVFLLCMRVLFAGS